MIDSVQEKQTEPSVAVLKTRVTYASENDSWLKRKVISIIEYTTGRRKLEQVYTEIRTSNRPVITIWETALSKLNVQLCFNESRLADIPAKGPLVFLANHPFGVMDGLILGYLAARVRQSFIMLVNAVLFRDEKFSQFMLPIDFEETKAAMRTNIETRREVIRRLKNDEALVIFPSGGVATSKGFWGRADELPWKRFVVKMIQKTEATIIPVYFHGQNSRLFQIVSQKWVMLRMALLLNEARNKMGKEIHFNIGKPIPYQTIAGIDDRQDLLDYLQEEVFKLSNPAGLPDSKYNGEHR